MAKKGTRIKPPAAPVKIPTPTEGPGAQWHETLPQNQPAQPVKPSVNAWNWDQETKADLGQKILSIRNVHGFPNAALSHRMEAVWGMFTGIRTATDKATSTFAIRVTDPDTDPNAIVVNRTGAQNLVNFSLLVALTKLGVRPKGDRQWDIVAQEVETSDSPPIFVFSVIARKSVPRNLRLEQIEQGDADAAGASPAAGAAKGSKGGKAKASRAKELDLDDDMELMDEDEEFDL